MLDYQVMQPAHPAKDIWYFFMSCTNSAWRKINFNECLKSYYEIFKDYLDDNDIDMSFEEFAKEVKDRWAYGFALVPTLMSIALSPEKRDVLATWKSYWQFFKWRDATFSEPPKDDDHPMITELKKRFVDLVQEGHNLRFY